VIRRVDTSGYHDHRGDGTPGTSGDEGTPANRTPLNGPAALALDGQGNLFIAETESNRVRMVSTDGLIHTVAGAALKVTRATMASPS